MRRVVVVAAIAVAFACGPIDPPPPPAAPSNDCPAHLCDAYRQSGAAPVCGANGACLVTAQINGVLVVSLPTDAYFAPGRTFAVPFADLLKFTPTPTCSLPGCAKLPDRADVSGVYIVSPDVAVKSHFNVGNAQGGPIEGKFAALPVHVTYRPVSGLPLSPVDADVALDVTGDPGPAAGPNFGFITYLQAGKYERTVMPDAPFDRAFPPDVGVVEIAGGRASAEADSIALDVTRETGEGPTYPTFDITRVQGLDGWSAWLRDATSKRRISNVASLSGTQTRGVQLATNHHPPNGEALTNAELVIHPPQGTAVPSGVFAPIGNILPRAEAFPSLPVPATVRGSIRSAVDGAAVAADVIFEAIGVFQSDARGGFALNTTNFEWTARTSADIDESGAATYQVLLPRGQFRAIVRPRDDASAVTIVEPIVIDVGGDPGRRDLVVQPRLEVTGSAVVTDGRPLAGARVEALPAQCFRGSSPWCLPRAPRTPVTTALDGTFALKLDPGGYVVRVIPAAGTRFPWVVRTTFVGASGATLAPMVVPAPVPAGLRLVDAKENPIVRAVVRVFAKPPGAPPVEVGSAVTDATGAYEMYLAP